MSKSAKIITKFEDLTNKYDLITYVDYDNDGGGIFKHNIVKLTCGHCFQYDLILKSSCIFSSFKGTLRSSLIRTV